MRAAGAAAAILEALERGREVAEVVVLVSSWPGVEAGSRMVVGREWVEGSLGAAFLDEQARELGRNALETERPLDREVVSPDGAACALYVDPHLPADRLVIVGAGHIARPLCTIAASLGFEVIVLDDRPLFATSERFPEARRVLRVDFADPFAEVPLGRRSWLVLVTRGHKYDFEALRLALREPEPPRYVGMVGSQRRVRAAMEQLVREGISPDRLRGVFSPIGLDIGAETPEEIAVSIAGELVRHRRGGTGASLRDVARVVDRWIERGREG